MLGSLDPVIIFQIYKKLPASASTLASLIAKIPSASGDSTKTTFAVVPIYLSEDLTGIFIDNESKSIDIDTNVEPLSDGEGSIVTQKTIGSITTVNLLAKQGSIGLTILLALSEVILDKTVSQEYEVTYMHGAVTVFGGLIHGFSFDQGGNDDLIKIKIELSRGRPKTGTEKVKEKPDALRLESTGTTPPVNAPTVSPPPSGGGGTSVIAPGRT